MVETIGRLANSAPAASPSTCSRSYADAELMRDDLYYGDPSFFFDHCKREHSRHVALLHDYGLWEWTIVVRSSGPWRKS